MSDGYTGPERRGKHPEHAPHEGCPLHLRVEEIERQLKEGDGRMGAIEASLKENTSITAEIYEIVKLGKGFFRAAGVLGRFIKWVSTIAAGLAAIFAIFHSTPRG